MRVRNVIGLLALLAATFVVALAPATAQQSPSEDEQIGPLGQIPTEAPSGAPGEDASESPSPTESPTEGGFDDGGTTGGDFGGQVDPAPAGGVATGAGGTAGNGWTDPAVLLGTLSLAAVGIGAIMRRAVRARADETR